MKTKNLPPYVHFEKKKLTGYSYYYVVRVGKSLRCKRGFITPEQAYASALIAKGAVSPSNNPAHSLRMVLELWIASLSETLVRETIKSYRGYFEHWVFPFLDEKTEYTKITDSDLQLWRSELAKTSVLNTKGKNRIISAFKLVNKFASIYLDLENKALLRIPKFTAEDLTPFFLEEDLNKAITAKELSRILSHCDSFLYLLFSIAFCGGLRVGEARAIRVECVKGNLISIVAQAQSDGRGGTLIRKLKTAGSRRLVFLPNSLSDLLQQHIMVNKLKPSDFVFFSSASKRTPISGNYISYNLRRVLTASKVRIFSFHKFRHSVSTYLKEHNISDQTIKLILGHESSDTTNKYYIHASQKELDKVVKLYDQIFKNPKNVIKNVIKEELDTKKAPI